jgi:hypothetical protein
MTRSIGENRADDAAGEKPDESMPGLFTHVPMMIHPDKNMTTSGTPSFNRTSWAFMMLVK